MPPLPDTNQNGRQFFYCNGKISTEINGDACWRFLQANDLILAQNNHKTPGLPITLVACDQQRSVLSMYEGVAAESQAYSPYGHHIQRSGLLSLLAFNGERQDAITGHYHLGNGYRQFSPVMMRFCSPDSWSPFGAGGFNAYVYCAGDPTNRTDPTGHFWGIGKFFRRLFGMKPKAPKVANTGMPVSEVSTDQGGRSSSVIANAAQVGESSNPFELLSNSETDQQLKLLEKYSTRKEKPRHDTMTSEDWADFERRFEAIKSMGASSKPKQPASGKSATWPRARAASKNYLDFTGNYIDEEVYRARSALV
ncbi:RHS repeat-associated core domain-containing protein [Pseudomonas sp. TWI929]|uniref:RHS repeat-associated core domain-containing protein n=1 Tax=Pseudomonas sp. TWI929 TaxID=3136795 RepID=UPI003207B12B